MVSVVSQSPSNADERPRGRTSFLGRLLSLLSDSAIYGISSVLSQIVGLLLVPLYTSYLTPADQGVITMIVTVLAFFTPLGTLGMVNAVFRRFNLDKSPVERRRLLSTAMVSVATSTLVVLAIGLAFAGPISRLAVGDSSATGLVCMLLISTAAATMGMVPLAMLRADRRVKTTAAINISKLLISVAFTVWLLVVNEWGMWAVVVGPLIGEVTMLIVQLALTLRNFGFGASWSTWKQMAGYALPMVPHQIQGMAMAVVGQYAVGSMMGLDEAGLYSTAVRFTLPVVFVVNSVQNAWMAYKFQVHAEDDDPTAFFRSIVTYYVAALLYLWVGIALWGPELLWLMTESSYHEAAWLVAIVGLIPVSQGIYFMLGTGMELNNNTKPISLVTLAGLIAAVVSVLTLIPRFGAAGAAMASINSFIVLTIVIFYFSQRRLKIHYDWSTLCALLALAGAAGLAGYVELDRPAVERIGLCVIISLLFPACEFAILLRSSSERYRMRMVWQRLARRRVAGT